MKDTPMNQVVGFDLSMDLVDEIENEKSKGIRTNAILSFISLQVMVKNSKCGVIFYWRCSRFIEINTKACFLSFVEGKCYATT
jgi:hypothetical protein